MSASTRSAAGTRDVPPAALASLSRWVRRPSVLAMSALVVVSFVQLPGKSTFDTKLDLTVDPLAFMGRALHLWNPAATSGELQNQAYGYLFPMGPYFGLCQLLGLPEWVAQRLWGALLMCLACYGTLALARALKIGSEPARLVGGLAYALSPRMLTEIGSLSAEMLPVAMLPWVMLPLVRADRIGSVRRAAGLSGLAVLCMGGINAAMVVLALLLPVLWLLSREWNARHVSLVAWWCVCVLGATLWWILPLLLLGQYSLPFLDYIESASNTTAPISLFEAMRGTNQWVAYVVQGTPWWPAGWMLVDNPVLMLATGLVAAVGMIGLVRAGLPERRFLVLGVVVGVTLLTVGYVGAVDSPLAGTVRELLDGALAPLRNVHKLEPVLRLPLTLAFIHGLGGVLPGLRGAPDWLRRHAKVGLGLLLVVVMAAPAWTFTLRPGPGWNEIPDYWPSAMGWLAEADPDGRTLLLPATGFGEYNWGRTVDEPAQALARSPWAVRNQIPLGSEGNTRVMDAVEDTLTSGRGSVGLADFLARSGFRFLLMRNDIDTGTTGSPPLGLLHSSLAHSPGIQRVATFGPPVAPATPDARSSTLDNGPAVPALEIYEVRRPVPLAHAVSMADVNTVSGGPESLLPLVESGQLDRERPTVLAGDGGAGEGNHWWVTDGLLRRERNVSRVHGNLSQTLTEREPPRQDRPTIDVLPFPSPTHQTTAAYRGIRGVAASTAASYADAFGGSDPSRLPFAAVDGNLSTAWHSSSFTGPAGQWLELELDTPQVLDEVNLAFVDDIRVGWPVTRIQIITDAGSTVQDVPRGATLRPYPTAPGLTSKIRINVLEVGGRQQTGNVGITELSVPDVRPQRALRAPTDVAPGASRPTGFSFTRGALPRYSCGQAGEAVTCDAGLARQGEEATGLHRLFRTPADAQYQVGATVLPAMGAANPVRPPWVDPTVSSQLGGDPAAGALSAVDGSSATAWTADVTDLRPTIRLRWFGQRTISDIQVTPGVPTSSRPTELELSTSKGKATVKLNADGRASFPPFTTDQVDIAVTSTRVLEQPVNRPQGPPGIGEIRISGMSDVLRPVAPNTPFTVPCGQGPTIHIDGQDYATSVSGTLADITEHRVLPARACEELALGVDLAAGEHELRTERSEFFVVQDLWLRPAAAPQEAPRQRAVEVALWDATHREIKVGEGPEALLTIPENANDGWAATVDGQPLARTRVDGWQQAWVLPAGGATTVSLDFGPDTDYRSGLGIGALTALLLVLATFLPVRRTVRISTAPGGQHWIPIALVAGVVVLAGMPAIIALIVCLLIRQFWTTAPGVLAFAGMAMAGVVSTTGRILGYGQEWAYGSWSQLALVVSIAAVVSVCIRWFDGTRPTPEIAWPTEPPDPSDTR